MWTCLLLGLITVTAAIFVDSNGDRKLSYESKIEQLERKVKKDKEEMDAWLDIVEKLEEKFHDIRNDKTEALSRKKRGIYDPRLGYFVGQPGPRGSPGNPGVPGRIGRRGRKGHKGITGSPGQRGPQGPYGPPGWSGPPGFEGPVGEKGEKGVAGFYGYPGLTGSVGYVGYDGVHGRQGIKGEMGYIGFIGMPGDPGMSGEPGMIGLIGEQGSRGVVGLPGPVGAFGDPGLMGERGLEGPEGLHGMVGQKGERGEPGDFGPWGPVGAPGIIYDPYITILRANALLPTPGVNCTDGDTNSTGCSNNYDKYMQAPVVDVSSKSYMPIFAHPPPGAQVVPAEPVYGKSTFVFAPMPPDSEIDQDIEQYDESPVEPIDEAELTDDSIDLIATGFNDTDSTNGYNTTTDTSLMYTSDSEFGWYGNVTVAEVGEQSAGDDDGDDGGDDDDSDLDSSDGTGGSSDDTSD